MTEAPEGLPATVGGSRFDGGHHVLSAWPDDAPEAGEIEVRSLMSRAPGTPVRLRIEGGWVLPPHDVPAAREVVAA